MNKNILIKDYILLKNICGYNFQYKINNQVGNISISDDLKKIVKIDVNYILSQKLDIEFNKENLISCIEKIKQIAYIIIQIMPIPNRNEYMIFDYFWQGEKNMDELEDVISIFNTIYYNIRYDYQKKITLQDNILCYGDIKMSKNKVIDFINEIKK